MVNLTKLDKEVKCSKRSKESALIAIIENQKLSTVSRRMSSSSFFKDPARALTILHLINLDNVRVYHFDSINLTVYKYFCQTLSEKMVATGVGDSKNSSNLQATQAVRSVLEEALKMDRNKYFVQWNTAQQTVQKACSRGAGVVCYSEQGIHVMKEALEKCINDLKALSI
jgi:hypothetical protein